MTSTRILDSLKNASQRHRLLFWYDGDGEWQDAFDAFSVAGVEKVKVEGTEFRTKVRIVQDRSPDTRFLLYFPSKKPEKDADNWLLDLLLQGHEFKADRASLALQEVGLGYGSKDLAEKHLHFFKDPKRIQALKESSPTNDEDGTLRLKMMAILAGTPVEIDALLLHFLRNASGEPMLDWVNQVLGAAALAEPFWKEVERLFGYLGATPSLKDFAVFLFSAANPLNGKVQLRAHAKVFLQRWKDSKEYADSFRSWSAELEAQLHIRKALETQGDRAEVGESDTFEAFDKYVLHGLCRSFQKGAAATDMRALIQQRKASFWLTDHADGYAAIEQAIELRELLATAELSVDSIESGIHRYVSSWWRIDSAYRRCIWHLRKYGQVKLTEQISKWIETTYVGNFLLPLADRWGDRVVALDAWKCEGIPAQRQFFTEFVQPFLNRSQKVVVLISDALRYEAAADFAAQLQSENRWTAEVTHVFGSLPSYTQLGMASLLPGKDLAVDLNTSNASVDGHSAGGTSNRADILRAACAGRAAAVKASDFLALNSKTDGRDLMRDNDVIYVFHNKIDKVGDALATEVDAFDAVQDTFEDLHKLVKKAANINANNLLLTADHGFLFQQNEVDDRDLVPLPGEFCWQGRRFAFGAAGFSGKSVKSFTAAQLGLVGDWTATFPLSLGRFPKSGSGKRFVHGGFSLQEIVLPVVKIHKARSDDTETVEIEMLRIPNRITTGQISLQLFQDKPATGKTLPRTMRIAVFTEDSVQLTDARTHVFDSKDAEARNREVTILLTLSSIADTFNNQDVEIRLDEAVAGSDHFATYRHQTVRLHKPFASDFDD